jgi:hypothetical protein
MNEINIQCVYTLRIHDVRTSHVTLGKSLYFDCHGLWKCCTLLYPRRSFPFPLCNMDISGPGKGLFLTNTERSQRVIIMLNTFFNQRTFTTVLANCLRWNNCYEDIYNGMNNLQLFIHGDGLFVLITNNGSQEYRAAYDEMIRSTKCQVEASRDISRSDWIRPYWSPRRNASRHDPAPRKDNVMRYQWKLAWE